MVLKGPLEDIFLKGQDLKESQMVGVLQGTQGDREPGKGYLLILSKQDCFRMKIMF